MSEDYKKIALEDVKKGQRIQIALYHATHVESYTGTVVNHDPYWKVIALGSDRERFRVCLTESEMPDIFLLEDVPEPKVVSIETVTITRYDDGTEKTKTVPEGIPVSTRIETVAQFNAQEERLRGKILKDTDGDYWAYRGGQWRWTFATLSPGITWHTPTTLETIEQSLPMTIVENVGD